MFLLIVIELSNFKDLVTTRETASCLLLFGKEKEKDSGANWLVANSCLCLLEVGEHTGDSRGQT